MWIAEIATTIVWWYGIVVSHKNQATDSFFSLQVSQSYFMAVCWGYHRFHTNHLNPNMLC